MRCRRHNEDFETAEALQVHLLEHIINLEETVALDLSKLNDSVAQAVQAEQDAVTALNDLAAKLGASGNTEDQAAVDAIVSKLSGSTAPLAVATKADDPAPIPAPANGTEASTSNNETVASTPVDTTPVATQPIVTSAGRPLYKHVGANPVDGASWPNSGLVSADGQPLYYFSGDSDGTAHGGSNEWVQYEGSTSQNEANPLSNNTAAADPAAVGTSTVVTQPSAAEPTDVVTTDQKPAAEGGTVPETNATAPAVTTPVEGVSGAGNATGPVTAS